MKELKVKNKKYFNSEVLNSKIKYWLKLVIKLIANKYYKNYSFIYYFFYFSTFTFYL